MIYALVGLIPMALSSTDPVLITDVRLVDARGDHGLHDIWLEDGRIAGIDPEMVSSSAEKLDGSGLTLLPGLVDSHVHITQHPLGHWLDLSEADEREFHIRYLRSYLAWGVTTVLDPGIAEDKARYIRALSEDNGGPDVQILGPLFGPLDGYPSAIFSELEGVSKPNQIATRFDEFESLDPRGIKVTFEDGPIRKIWPLFSAEMLREIDAEAEARSLPIYVHAMDPEMTRKALKLEPHALVHASQKGGRALAREVKRSEAYVISTLVIVGGSEWMSKKKEKEWKRKRVKRSIPAQQRALLKDPDIMELALEQGLETYAPGMNSKQAERLIRIIQSSIPRRVQKAERALAHQHKVGVPLVLGSDSGGSPVVPYLVHGFSTHMELELLSRAGLSPLEVIRAATLTPAEMMGLEDELGTIEVGKRADLIVVEGDPLTDINALARPRWVIRDGDLRTPKEWLQN